MVVCHRTPRLILDIFYRLELIEAFGSGIPKMTEIYKDKGINIEFKPSPSGFMIVFPNLNYRNENVPSTTIEAEHGDPSKSLLDQRADAAAEIIQAKGPVSRQELEVVWEVGRSTASKWLFQLIESGYLIRIGSGRNTRCAKRHPEG